MRGAQPRTDQCTPSHAAFTAAAVRLKRRLTHRRPARSHGLLKDRAANAIAATEAAEENARTISSSSGGRALTASSGGSSTSRASSAFARISSACAYFAFALNSANASSKSDAVPCCVSLSSLANDKSRSATASAILSHGCVCRRSFAALSYSTGRSACSKLPRLLQRPPKWLSGL